MAVMHLEPCFVRDGIASRPEDETEWQTAAAVRKGKERKGTVQCVSQIVWQMVVMWLPVQMEGRHPGNVGLAGGTLPCGLHATTSPTAPKEEGKEMGKWTPLAVCCVRSRYEVRIEKGTSEYLPVTRTFHRLPAPMCWALQGGTSTLQSTWECRSSSTMGLHTPYRLQGGKVTSTSTSNSIRSSSQAPLPPTSSAKRLSLLHCSHFCLQASSPAFKRAVDRLSILGSVDRSQVFPLFPGFHSRTLHIVERVGSR
ncbi:hypothetical protein BDP55DRAFT_98945 [Colletotrichum godetiae]|uniref:Uncharacterized protein n=1 Tax=Colletotrichum godetiae TaxID=1209918 RepID=A0AAJ0AMP5_9PEZI|nr:uncharacterized protein BDP55DRAFT_98945 [Colletotrichum godetiae]KAK1676725.1 hypothetical protein BDP55DRAFT_98945 [Colletotrichum godetiae]